MTLKSQNHSQRPQCRQVYELKDDKRFGETTKNNRDKIFVDLKLHFECSRFFLSDKKQTTQLFLILNAYILYLTNNLVNKTFLINIFNIKQIEKSIQIFSFVFEYYKLF